MEERLTRTRLRLRRKVVPILEPSEPNPPSEDSGVSREEESLLWDAGNDGGEDEESA